MKKLLVIICMLFSVTAFAQFETSKYRMEHMAIRVGEPDETDFGEWEDVNILVVIDGEQKTVKCFNKDLTSYYMVAFGSETKELVDKDGDVYGTVIFEAIDYKNRSCWVKFQEWENLNIFQLYVYYDAWTFVYEGFKLD